LSALALCSSALAPELIGSDDEDDPNSRDDTSPPFIEVMDPIQVGDVMPFMACEFSEFIDDSGVTVLPAAGDIQGPPVGPPPEPGMPDIPVGVGAVTLVPIGTPVDDIMLEVKDCAGE
jgi:hypothetical protein